MELKLRGFLEVAVSIIAVVLTGACSTGLAEHGKFVRVEPEPIKGETIRIDRPSPQTPEESIDERARIYCEYPSKSRDFFYYKRHLLAVHLKDYCTEKDDTISDAEFFMAQPGDSGCWCAYIIGTCDRSSRKELSKEQKEFNYDKCWPLSADHYIQK